jgi:hypothetical protein
LGEGRKAGEFALLRRRAGRDVVEHPEFDERPSFDFDIAFHRGDQCETGRVLVFESTVVTRTP